MNVIRLDARATDLWESLSEGGGPVPGDGMRVLQAIRNADVVIDAQDRVIKDRNRTDVPRAAFMNEIEASTLVQG